MMVQEGRITLGGVELSEISRQEVMGKIAFVFQNPKLLKATLEEVNQGFESEYNVLLRLSQTMTIEWTGRGKI